MTASSTAAAPRGARRAAPFRIRPGFGSPLLPDAVPQRRAALRGAAALRQARAPPAREHAGGVDGFAHVLPGCPARRLRVRPRDLGRPRRAPGRRRAPRPAPAAGARPAARHPGGLDAARRGESVGWLLTLLLVLVGLPFFVVSASAPLLQRWLAATSHPAARDPYFLYRASNVGGMVGLLGYPIAMEPSLRLADQGRLWSAGYLALAALIAACAIVRASAWPSSARGRSASGSGSRPCSPAGPPPSARRRPRFTRSARSSASTASRRPRGRSIAFCTGPRSGAQAWDGRRPPETGTYYHPSGPIGQALDALAERGGATIPFS